MVTSVVVGYWVTHRTGKRLIGWPVAVVVFFLGALLAGYLEFGTQEQHLQSIKERPAKVIKAAEEKLLAMGCTVKDSGAAIGEMDNSLRAWAVPGMCPVAKSDERHRVYVIGTIGNDKVIRLSTRAFSQVESGSMKSLYTGAIEFRGVIVGGSAAEQFRLTPTGTALE